MLSPAMMGCPLRIMPLEPCSAVRASCSTYPKSYLKADECRHMGPAAIGRHVLAKLEAARARDVAAHAANEKAIANNKVIVEHVTALMKGLGFPGQWSEVDHKSRARTIKRITVTAGYLGDLAKHCPTNDGFEQATYCYQSLLRDYTQFAKDCVGEEETAKLRAEREKREEQDKRKADMELAALLLRYSLPIDTDWNGVLEALEEKDQRVRLALAMRATRNDWSDGPGAVRHALSRFSPVSVEDHQIADDVQECLDHWDGDGRIFRDTAWNYDRLLLAVADSQLAADALLAAERCDEQGSRW